MQRSACRDRRSAPLLNQRDEFMVTKVWDDPDIFNIQVDLPQNPLRFLNVYVIVTPEQNLLIDTGFNRQECSMALWAGIGELGLDLKKTSIFLTHLHSDHTGLAWDFVQQGCPIYMGQIDYQYLNGMKNRNNLSAMEALFRQEGFPEIKGASIVWIVCSLPIWWIIAQHSLWEK